MPQHILLLEPKLKDAEELALKIKQHRGYVVHRVNTMREACSELTQRTIDLALVPVTRNDSLVYSLRMLQPDLPLILIADSDQQAVPTRQEQVVWGIITRSVLQDALPELDLLAEDKTAVERLFWQGSTTKTGLVATPIAELSSDQLAPIAQQLLNQRAVRFVMFLKDKEIIGFHSTDDQDQLVEAAEEVRALWNGVTRDKTQIQYLDQNRNGRQENWLNDTLVLFTRPFGPYLITVGAYASTRVSDIRHLVQGISDKVFSEVLNNANGFVRQLSAGPEINQRSFVLVWQPADSLSADARRALRQILPRIARSLGITLEHLIINEKFVHLVAVCPPQKGSGWLAQSLKDLSAAAMAEQLVVPTPLWIDGYYARESTNPLSAAELNRLIMLPRS